MSKKFSPKTDSKSVKKEPSVKKTGEVKTLKENNMPKYPDPPPPPKKKK